MQVDFDPDLDLGKTLSVKLTLTTADTVRTVAVPSWAKWVKMYPDKLIRFALGENPPAAEAAVADNNVVAANLGVGGYAAPLVWECRRIPRGAGYTLRMLDDVGGAVVYIEFAG